MPNELEFAEEYARCEGDVKRFICSLVPHRLILGAVFTRSLFVEHQKLFDDPLTIYSPNRCTISFRWFIRVLSDRVRILVAANTNDSQ